MSDCDERREGMTEVLTALAVLSEQMSNQIKVTDELKKDMKDVSEIVNWTKGQLKGNGKTTLEKFHDEDKEHRKNLELLRADTNEGFKEIAKSITDAVAPVSKRAQENSSKIFKITVAIFTVGTICLGAIGLFIKILSLWKEIYPYVEQLRGIL